MIALSHPTAVLRGTVDLPTSKSISNRALIVQALYCQSTKLEQLSKAKDTLQLMQMLASEEAVVSAQDAGTAMRFYTAYAAAVGRSVELIGTPRMHQRPIAELVQGLRALGARIDYLGEEGFPPLRVHPGSLSAAHLQMNKVRSSQFVSALCMLLPGLEGASIQIDAHMHSGSFVDLTLDVMRGMGLEAELQDGCITARKGACVGQYSIEKDWTSFYYFLSCAVLSKQADIFFPGLTRQSIQTEAKWLDQFSHPLLNVTEQNGGLHLKRSPGTITLSNNTLDLKDHPDLAPTFALLWAGLGQAVDFLGLESLRIKESDRDKAIAEQLAQLAVQWSENDSRWQLRKAGEANQLPFFRAYEDHRMMMSAAPLALKGEILLEDSSVVGKSYGHFWQDLLSLGFQMEEKG